MSTISSPGIGSGLDISGIVSKLMTVESIPLNQLKAREASFQTKITAYGQVQSGLSAFQSTLFNLSNINAINAISATSSDPSILSATTTAGAQAGNFNIAVTQLAQSQQLVSAGQVSSTSALGSGSSTTLNFEFGTIAGTKLPNKTYDVGTTFTSNGNANKTLTIDATNNTLGGIRDAINAAGMGVTASIINDGGASPFRLLLTNTQTGLANSMKISVTGDATIADLLTQDPSAVGNQKFQETEAAQNANVNINGVSVTNSSNVLTNNIQGVTVTLNKTNVGSTVNLNLSNNTTGLTSSITNFVGAYNSLSNTLKDLTSYDLKTRSGAELYGESTIIAAQRQIKNVVLSTLPAGSNAFTVLNNIGITFQKDGSLAVDNTKLKNAITSNFNAVASLFAASAKTTDSLIQFNNSSSDTKTGTYAVNVSTLPTRGTQLSNATPNTLAINAVNENLVVKLDGITASVQLINANYTSASSLAASIQAQINGTATFSNINAAISVTADNTGRLVFTSNRFGGASSVVLGGAGDTATNNLLGGGGTSTQGIDMNATLNGSNALSSGQFILGPISTPQSGLKLQVLGGTTGARGSVTYTQGVAYQLNQLVNSLTGANGLITTRTNGINSSIRQIEAQKAQLQIRLDVLQKQYQSTYNALDATLAGLNSTSTYLTGQLKAIAANSISSKD